MGCGEFECRRFGFMDVKMDNVLVIGPFGFVTGAAFCDTGCFSRAFQLSLTKLLLVPMPHSTRWQNDGESIRDRALDLAIE